jgi:hypothetical protein
MAKQVHVRSQKEKNEGFAAVAGDNIRKNKRPLKGP